VKQFKSIEGRTELRETFREQMTAARQSAPGYTAAVQALSPAARQTGTDWLASIRSEFVHRCREALPFISV
jgi:hypothetical protein